MSALLAVEGLTVELATPTGHARALEGLDLVVRPGESLALVGESGSGKTLAALAVLGLLPPAARVAAGRILFRGRDLAGLPPAERRALCGRELAMSFQEPASALNPVLPVGEQVAEGLRVLGGLSRKAARTRALELLEEVRLERAAEHARRYPHELSGGQRQRVMLAIALALGPSLLIADEPTSALDAPVAREIVALLAELRARREMALVLITHDLGVVRTLATRVAVLYAGRIVEEAGTEALFERAAHPYTVGLLRSRTSALVKGLPLPAIPGQIPSVGAWPGGCRFHPRCALADARCRVEEPRLLPAPGPVRDSGAATRAPAVPELREPDETLELCTERVACHHAGEAGAP